MKVLETVLQKKLEAGLKVNTEKLFLGRIETEYLSLWIRKEGAMPPFSKVESIKAIDAPTKVHDTSWFLGIVNNYRYMWCNCAHKLTPLTKLWSTKVKFKCTDVEKCIPGNK